jgi:hypothetical protein
MDKNIFFRKGNDKLFLNKEDIDMAILLKVLIDKSLKKTKYNNFLFLEKYFNINDQIGIGDFTVKDILIGLENIFNNKNCYDTYKSIIIEELEYYNNFENNNLIRCYIDKIDILLINILPFINYPYNITSYFLIENELLYYILNLIKKDKKDYKNLIFNNIFNNYINTELFKEDHIGIILYKVLKNIREKNIREKNI